MVELDFWLEMLEEVLLELLDEVVVVLTLELVNFELEVVVVFTLEDVDFELLLLIEELVVLTIVLDVLDVEVELTGEMVGEHPPVIDGTALAPDPIGTMFVPCDNKS